MAGWSHYRPLGEHEWFVNPFASFAHFVVKSDFTMKHSSFCILCSAFFILHSTFCISDEPPARDYTAGFEKFFQMGLPDVRDAAYVRLDIHSGHHRLRQDMHDHFLHYEIKLQGNAWLLQENKQGKSLFLTDDGRQLEVYEQKTYAEIQRQRQAEANKGKTNAPPRSLMPFDESPEIGGVWKPVEIKADNDRILAYLQKQSDAGERNEMRFRQNAPGVLFLRAALLHRKGYTNEANRIAAALFGMAKDPRRVIAQGLNLLADGQYATVYARFQDPRDWAAYQRGLEELLMRFGAGWQKTPAVKRLVDLVKTRQTQTDPPPVIGEGLTDEDQRLARALARTNATTCRLTYGGLWLLPGTSPRGGAKAAGTNDPIERLCRRSMASAPLLLAMVKDDTLIDLKLSQLQGYVQSYSYSSRDEDEPSEARVEQLFNTLERPATRADLARLLLKQALLVEDRERHALESMPRDEFAALAREWYEAHKDKPPADLARLYLEQGRDDQQVAALRYLLKMRSPSGDFADIEKFLLTEADPQRDENLIRTFVTAREEKAKPFVEQLAAALGVKTPDKKQTAADGDHKAFTATPDNPEPIPIDEAQEDHESRRRQALIVSLRQIVSAPSVEELLHQAMENADQFHKVREALFRQVAKQPLDKALTVALEAATKTEDVEIRAGFLSLASSLKYRRQFSFVTAMEDENDAEASTPTPETVDITTHAVLWNTLVEDRRAPEKGRVFGVRSIAETAAWTIESLYGPDDRSDVQGSSFSVGDLGQRGMDFMLARAKARLTGKTEDQLPAMPSAARVDAIQRQALVAALSSSANLQATVSALNLDAVLAVMEECGNHTNLNTRLRVLADGINEVTVDPALKDAEAWTAALKDKSFDKTTVENLMALCKQHLTQGEAVMCNMTREGGFNGIKARIELLKPDGASYREGNRRHAERRTALMVVNFSGGHEHHAYATWPLEAPTNTAAQGRDGSPSRSLLPSKAADTDDDLLDSALDELNTHMQDQQTRQRDEFWKQVDAALREGNAADGLSLTIIGLPPLTDKEKEELKRQSGGY